MKQSIGRRIEHDSLRGFNKHNRYDVATMVLLLIAAMHHTFLSVLGQVTRESTNKLARLRTSRRIEKSKVRLAYSSEINTNRTSSYFPDIRSPLVKTVSKLKIFALGPAGEIPEKDEEKSFDVLKTLENISSRVSSRRVVGNHVYYLIEIQINSSIVTIWKRYSELHQWHKSLDTFLVKETPVGNNWKKNAHPFPAKNWHIHNLDDKFLDDRQESLNQYIRERLSPGLFDAVTVGRVLRRNARFLGIQDDVLPHLLLPRNS